VSAEFFLLGLLSVILVASNVFWARLVKELTAKVMSRSHYEFVQAEKLKEPRPAVRMSEDDQIHPDDERQAQVLNSFFGVV
jgi:hypothetical protein